MREAIEGVVAELTERRKRQAENVKIFGNAPEPYGRIKELEHAIKLLQEVLNNASIDPHRADGSGQNDTEQQMDKPNG